MAAVSSLSTLSTQLDTAAAGRSGAKDSAKELNDRFMKLLVAQLKNQDPLNPTDNAQFTTQMAQINTVSGISNLNGTVTQLLDQFQRLEAMQAAQLAGRNVLVAGNTLSVDAETASAISDANGATVSAAAASALRGGYELAGAADQVKVQVRDASGTVVRSFSVEGGSSAGLQRFSWDGRNDAGQGVKAGDYSFRITATQGADAVAATQYAARRVEGVSSDPSGINLQLAGGKTVAYADIKQIL